MVTAKDFAVDADFQWLLGGQYVFREPYWLFGA
jgi:hypothetical protein